MDSIPPASESQSATPTELAPPMELATPTATSVRTAPTSASTPATPRPGKRTVDGSPRDTPQKAYKRLRRSRDEELKRQAEGHDYRLAELKQEMWEWMRDMCNDIVEGRADANLIDSWDGGLEEMSDLLDERDALVRQEKKLLKEVSRLEARCEKLAAELKEARK